MIEYVKLTGKSEPPYYEVKVRSGECLYAKLSIAGFGVPLPSSKWYLSNKDKFLALLTYEGDDYDQPILLGFCPLENADSSDTNIYERHLEVTTRLVERLLKAKVNTQIGPQPFLVDTLQELNQLKTELQQIKALIEEV